MIADAELHCDSPHSTVWRGEVDVQFGRHLMATHSFGPGSTPSNSYSGSPAWNQAYVVAALRAGLIALALLGVLALIALS